MKRIHSRILTLLVTLTLVLGMVAGCAKPADNDDDKKKDPVTLTLWHAWSGAEEEALNAVIDKYKEANDHVTFDLLPLPFEDLQNKLKASLGTDEAPDLFIGPSDWAGVHGALGNLEDVSSYISDVKSQYLEPALKAGEYKGVVYGIPESVETYVLIYNKDIIKDAPKTMDELRTLAKENTKDGNYGVVFDLANWYYAHAFFGGFGGKTFVNDDFEPGFGGEEFKNALNLLNDIKNTDKVTLKNFDYNAMMDLFMTGKTPMIINGPWCFGDIDKAVAENKGIKNWGIAKVPAVAEGKPARPYMGTKMFYIPKKAENKEVAADFAKFAGTPDMQKVLNEKAGHIPANKTVDLGDNWKAKGILDAAADAIPMPNAPEMGAIWGPAGDALNAVLSGKSKVDAAATAAQEKMIADIKALQGK